MSDYFLPMVLEDDCGLLAGLAACLTVALPFEDEDTDDAFVTLLFVGLLKMDI